MPTWKDLYRDSMTDAEQFASVFGLDASVLGGVLERYPALVNPYQQRLCLKAGAPIIRQVIPDLEELSEANASLSEDPTGEESWSPVPNLTHRYEDRVLFLVSDLCPIYCRFCTRKRKVGRTLKVTPVTLEAGFDYIASHKKIRDVLLSGGDPLMLEDHRLASILERLRGIGHVEILRIGTRVPSALPQRITRDLVSLLSAYQPLFVHTHFNHPAELSEESLEACRLLADAGIPLSNQTVLLRGVNDDPDTLETLFRALLKSRIKPYYLFQADMVRGTEHFRTPLSQGLRIMEDLHLRTSPMALPTFVVDLPGGAGKVFPSRSFTASPGGFDQFLRAPDGTNVPYPDPE